VVHVSSWTQEAEAGGPFDPRSLRVKPRKHSENLSQNNNNKPVACHVAAQKGSRFAQVDYSYDDDLDNGV
jgi:hypothetical protein